MVFIAFYFLVSIDGWVAGTDLASGDDWISSKSGPKEDIVMRKVVNSLLLGVALIMVGYAQPSSLMSLTVTTSCVAGSGANSAGANRLVSG